MHGDDGTDDPDARDINDPDLKAATNGCLILLVALTLGAIIGFIVGYIKFT